MEDALTFRTATRDDVEAIVALVESAYRGDASREGWSTEADLLEGQRTDANEVLERVTGEHSRMILAERGGSVLACVHIGIEDGFGHLGMFSVRPTLQQGGIGKSLLAEAERVARDEWRMPAMRMHVIDVREELIAFYVRRGYRRTGITEPFPYGDERFGVPLRDDLRFEVLEKELHHG